MSTSLRPLESYQGSAKYVTIRPDYLGNRAPITGCPGVPERGTKCSHPSALRRRAFPSNPISRILEDRVILPIVVLPIVILPIRVSRPPAILEGTAAADV